MSDIGHSEFITKEFNGFMVTDAGISNLLPLWTFRSLHLPLL